MFAARSTPARGLVRRRFPAALLVRRLDAVAGTGRARLALADAALAHPPDLRSAVSGGRRPGAAVLAANAPPRSTTDAAWEDPPRSAAPTDAPVLSAEGFEGPLDWLLDLARAQKIDLAKLPIAALIGSFAEALEAALARPRGVYSGAVAMGRLAGDGRHTDPVCGSKLLLPADAPDARAALSEAEALRHQVVQREQIRAAADWLEHRTQLGRDVFSRGTAAGSGTRRAANVTDLLRACLVLLRVPEEQAAAYRPRPPPFWRVSDAIARINRVLGVVPAGGSLAAFLPVIDREDADRDIRCRAALASTLVAGLELARGGVLTLHQDGPWREVTVARAAEVRPPC